MEEEYKNTFIRVDNNKVLNRNMIRWIKKYDECLEICNKSDGCTVGESTHRLCKLYNPESYEKLNKLFDAKN